jgi:hypothetical protein
MSYRSTASHPEFHAYRRLLVRGRMARTFGGLAAFLAIILFLSGFYILSDLFQNSVSDSSAPAIGAAFCIALASLLAFYILKPSKVPRHSIDLQFVAPPAKPAELRESISPPKSSGDVSGVPL